MQATIHIKGRVQGVFFRSTGKEEAEKRGLLVGSKMKTMDQFQPALIDWCNHGPSIR